MRKILTILLFGILLLSVTSVSAGGGHQSEITEGKKLVESKVTCDNLNDEQLESIGEYYMEQMHPKESHDIMHKMMGIEEGTRQHDQLHVNLAKFIYCGEEGVFGPQGMMNMMGSGMMGDFGNFGYWNFINILYILLLIGLIILVYLWIIKLWKNLKNKGGKK